MICELGVAGSSPAYRELINKDETTKRIIGFMANFGDKEYGLNIGFFRNSCFARLIAVNSAFKALSHGRR